MNNATRSARRRQVALGLAAALIAAISWLPAGIGNVGRKSTELNGSFIRVTLPGGVQVTYTIDPNDTGLTARDNLVTKINTDTAFDAVAVDDPADSSLAAFLVTDPSAPAFIAGPPKEIRSLGIEENDTNLDDIGVRFPLGTAQLIFNKTNAAGNTVAGNGIYRLRVEALYGTDYDQTFNTAVPPNNTSAGLNASIKSSLEAAGFTVVDSGTTFTVSRQPDVIIAAQVDSSDTGIFVHNVTMQPMPAQGFVTGLPTMSEYALFILAMALTAAGMILLRGKKRASPG